MYFFFSISFEDTMKSDKNRKRCSEIEHGPSPGIFRFLPGPKCVEKNWNKVLVVVSRNNTPDPDLFKTDKRGLQNSKRPFR